MENYITFVFLHPNQTHSTVAEKLQIYLDSVFPCKVNYTAGLTWIYLQKQKMPINACRSAECINFLCYIHFNGTIVE
jgi:hypothetical protein